MTDANVRQEEIDATSMFLGQGIWLEEQILRAGIRARESSKSGYKQEWLDARLFLLSISAKLLRAKNAVAGNTDHDRSHRILLILAFYQGVHHTESAISEAQYIKAAAILKQDFEILTRVREVKAGKAIPGKTPQVQHAPAGSQRFYGQLNNVAHPSNPAFIEQLLDRNQRGEAVGPSFVPRYLAETANSLYELHVWLLLEMTRELILLFAEFYGERDVAVGEALVEYEAPLEILKRAGFEISDTEAAV